MCNQPIDFERLTAYWLGELAGAEEEKLEEHLLGCAHCAGRLEWLVALSAGVRDALREGKVGLAVSARFVEAMKRAGLRLREYQLDPGGRVDCTIGAQDDAVVSCIRAPLGGVKRLDVLHSVEVGGVAQPEVRVADVPFDAAAGAVFFIPPPAALKRMPAHMQHVRLLAVDEAGERMVGDYTFAHTPS
jgi:hypothetical protein